MKYILLIFCTFPFSVLSSQSSGVFQLNGLVVDRTNFVASISFRPLNFDNNCLIIQTGLYPFRTKKSDWSIFFPCADTKEVIKLKLIVFPNPSSDQITIKAQYYKNSQRNCLVRITDLLGRIVLSSKYKLVDLQRGLTLNVSSLAAGTYCIVIQGDDLFGAAQFIKITK